MERVVLSLFLAVVLVLPAAIARAAASAPVGRDRLEAFAARHRLTVTAVNGKQILAYLATTRRWRAAGLAAGATLWLLWTLRTGGVGVNALPLLAGWFVGALVAEARVARLAHGQRRVATLARREPGLYLRRGTSLLVPAGAMLAVAVAAGTAAVAAYGGSVNRTGALAWFAAAVAIAAAVRVAQRRTVGRAQPMAAPDVLAADDAIRSRSLHALTGAGVVLTLYCVCGQLWALSGAAPDAVAIANLAIGISAPALGYGVATARWPVLR